MKVLAYVVNSPPHSRIGAFIATHKFLVGLQEAGHEVLCLVENKVGDYVHEGIRYKHEGPFLAEQIRRSDVVITNAGSRRGPPYAINNGKPLIVIAHGSSPGFAERLVHYGQPALVVFNSESLSELAMAQGFVGAFTVCRPPVNPADFAIDPGDHITLVNMTEEKGAHTFDQLARYMPDRKFLAVTGGYGDQVDIWRPNITLVPTTPFMRDAVYAKTRILLMPGLLETWGLVGVEAMCAGIPVIAHPAMGPLESLDSAGIFADRMDLDAWIDAIEGLDNPRTYHHMSALGRKRAAELYAENSVARFVSAVEEVAG